MVEKIKLQKELSEKPIIIFVIGGPGAGKGTQCKRIAEYFGIVHISIGDVLRDIRLENTPQGQMVDAYMTEYEKTGKLMPCNKILEIIKYTMQRLGWNHSIFILDGFLKTYEMYKYWEQDLGDDVIVKRAIYLECPQDVLEKRLLKRAETSGRTDDNIDTIRKRFDTFNSKTVNLINHFKQIGLLTTIDGTMSIESVFTEFKEIIIILFELYQ